MEEKNYSDMTDEELMIEKKKAKKSRTFFAFYIGFLIGIAIFGFGAWLMNPERRFGFLLPLLIPAALIYGLVKKRKNNSHL
ncbi:MAG TPA: hypothetical protein DDY13_19330 [Cytophagales bacterium]|jgi:hypothetical protein|nr:hypothetical protein [Cytophagales bacterium]